MKAPEPTSRAPAPRWTMVAKAVSSSLSVLTSRMMTCCAIAFAAVAISVTSSAVPGVAGLASTPINVALGASWRSSASRLVPSVSEKNTTPVMLPPGRLRLVTRPSLTGSPPLANTIGTVVVTVLATRAEIAFATITATWLLIKSEINAGSRSFCPSAERYSTATSRPSTKPTSLRPCRNAVTKWGTLASVALRRNPTTGIFGC